MKISYADLKEHHDSGHPYDATCMMFWFKSKGLDWKVFMRDGYDHEDLILHAGHNNEALNSLIEFVRSKR